MLTFDLIYLRPKFKFNLHLVVIDVSDSCLYLIGTEGSNCPGDSPVRAGVGALPVKAGALVHLKTPADRRKT
jgi:hypothetical protein